jgi:nicotinate-nucleotide adenylyltransferase
MPQTINKPLGILGGTFDPIHLGHIHLANEVYKQLNLQEIRFIPCYQSPFKKRPIATDEQRLTMLKLALKNHPEFIIDNRELQRRKISYTIDTVKSLRQEFANTPLYLIMSADAFSKFNLWRDWQEISQLANLAVANRPGSKKLLLNVLFINIDPLPISATKIRALISESKDASSLLPKSVWKFINQNKIYQRK